MRVQSVSVIVAVLGLGELTGPRFKEHLLSVTLQETQALRIPYMLVYTEHARVICIQPFYSSRTVPSPH